jgi:hypothetical protein
MNRERAAPMITMPDEDPVFSAERKEEARLIDLKHQAEWLKTYRAALTGFCARASSDATTDSRHEMAEKQANRVHGSR